ncbi:MAG: radical SAM protein [Candidatus Omnitrophota bacterium]|nr:radical SAM protein [Candidatus Omnitrophota bacterium]
MKIIFPVMGAENISVSYLSTVLKCAGHVVKVAFDRALFDDKQYFSIPFLHRMFSEKNMVIRRIIRERPDILAMSVFSDNYQWCLEVASEVRKRHRCITVWGGMHPTACPEEVIARDEVDYMIIGEGEGAFLELLEALKRKEFPGRIQNLWLKKDGKIVRNNPRGLMDSKGFPAVDKAIYEKFIPMKDYYLTVTSKGCIANCSYCLQNFLRKWEEKQGLGPFLREKPVDAVLDELKTMKRRYGIRYVDIKNNVLSGNRMWLDEFINRYSEEVRLPFRIMGHPLLFQGDEAIRLKKAGCNHIQIGVESLNPEVRKNALLRNETNEQIMKGIDNIDKAGINFSVDLMIGLPGESEEDLILALKTLAHYRNLIRVSIFWLQYLPEVDITKMALAKGYISKENENMIIKGLQDNYLSTGSPMEPERKRILKTYHIMFRMLPIIPCYIMDFLVNSRMYYIFRYIPFQILFIIVIDVVVSYVRRDYYAKWIMGWYIKHIFKRFVGKIDVISD